MVPVICNKNIDTIVCPDSLGMIELVVLPARPSQFSDQFAFRGVLPEHAMIGVENIQDTVQVDIQSISMDGDPLADGMGTG